LGYPALLGIFMVSSVSLFLCFYVSLSLCISVFPLYLSETYPNFKYACLLTRLPTLLSLSPPPSLFSGKKFPVVEAHFWMEKLFCYTKYKNF
jgi:hypothetical protein